MCVWLKITVDKIIHPSAESDFKRKTCPNKDINPVLHPYKDIHVCISQVNIIYSVTKIDYIL